MNEENNYECHSERCPTCNGFTTVNYGKQTCMTCKGNGFVIVPNKLEYRNQRS
jgi:DnaJ-class molecular chaperone